MHRKQWQCDYKLTMPTTQNSNQAEMHTVQQITNSTASPISKPHRKHRDHHDHQFKNPRRPPPSSASEFEHGPPTKMTTVIRNEPTITHQDHQAALVETGDRIEFAAGAESLRGSMYLWHVQVDFPLILVSHLGISIIL
ncbi:hypothetical protein R1flu_002530 [Riccia fluitans]|uniref:Uncharacterized protein n=1 Tax=Riccia fluitans TaxID=41844 RepID=A0ABD1Y6X3_9MARC